MKARVSNKLFNSSVLKRGVVGGIEDDFRCGAKQSKELSYILIDIETEPRIGPWAGSGPGESLPGGHAHVWTPGQIAEASQAGVDWANVISPTSP
ncbi:hypothetical protein BVRB_033890 [Beta vulgaris subsp. vulgaris]|uniref:Uncharacterized protein n=1 Tax=Beta vulgaris subsp. vulgaris TaxID=3555 RepID=A0A0J8A3E6_BETVV|nr:hypothetical protein BVRB_033890 [Beta vulgaris subsp. vulgaris]